jgi:DNA-binding response OmpR family regulator
VYALSVGADDHVSKPFSPTELIARIQSLLRRERKLCRCQFDQLSVFLKLLSYQIQRERTGLERHLAKVQEQDKVYALSVGADDHVSKPFSPTELIARIQSERHLGCCFTMYIYPTQ